MTGELSKLEVLAAELAALTARSPQNSATITMTSSGALTIIGVFAITIAIASVAIVASWRHADMAIIHAERAADMRELTALRDELHKVQTEQQTDRIWLQKHENRLGKEK